MARSQRLTIIIGGQETGKSTLADKVAQAYQKPVLIISPDRKSRLWSKYPETTLDKLNFRDKRHLVFDNTDSRTFYNTIFDRVNSAMVIIDEARVCINFWDYKLIESIIIRRRDSDIDMMFIYHGFKKIPELMWDYATRIILFRTDGSIKPAKKFMDDDEYELYVKRVTEVNSMNEKLPYSEQHLFKIYPR